MTKIYLLYAFIKTINDYPIPTKFICPKVYRSRMDAIAKGEKYFKDIIKSALDIDISENDIKMMELEIDET